MSSVNKVILIGRLGKDPELRYTSSGSAVCGFSIATDQKWTDKSGQKQSKTQWHNVTVWGVQGENCQKYLRKGSQVYVEGEYLSEKYVDKSGVERQAFKVSAKAVTFLSSANGEGERSEPTQSANVSGQFQESMSSHFNEDDIPF